MPANGRDLRRKVAIAMTLCIAASCRATPSQTVVIPKATQVADSDARGSSGLPYRPADMATVWLANDSIVIDHREAYAAYDMVGSTCAGSGVYLASGFGNGHSASASDRKTDL